MASVYGSENVWTEDLMVENSKEELSLFDAYHSKLEMTVGSPDV